MKNLLFICALLTSLLVFADSEKKSDNKAAKSSSAQESVNKSKPVGYVVALVKRGSNWEQDSSRAFQLQEKHLLFLAELQKENKLLASGPLTTSPDARGLYIFTVETISEAEALVSKDEAIKAGWIKMEFHNWEARDYEVKNTNEEVKSGFFSTGLGMLVIVFVLVILTLMLRTFRGKPSI